MDLGGAIAWFQTQPNLTKYAISFGIVIVAAILIIILWQPPATSAGGINQTGNVATTGQSGGVTAGLYINQSPPVTAQEKANALASLESEIEELANFPDRPDLSPRRTLLELLSKDTQAHQLYIILGKYYKPTIISVPRSGSDLYKYKVKYYNFESKEYNFEETTTTKIGQIVTVTFRQAWSIYLQYFLLRSLGLTQQNIIAMGNFLNYGITWDEAERIYLELSEDSVLSHEIINNSALFESLRTEAMSLMTQYKGQ